MPLKYKAYLYLVFINHFLVFINHLWYMEGLKEHLFISINDFLILINDFLILINIIS